MKHFEISIKAKRHEFIFKCTTAAEAYEAINDASISFGLNIDADEVMEQLIKIKREEILSCSNYNYRIYCKNGEI